MQKLYVLFVFMIGYYLQAQIVNIPDANFKAKLLIASSANDIASTETPIFNPINGTWNVSTYTSIDTNGDGEIQVSEAQAIKWLKVNYYTEFLISNLTGVEAFTNLIYLNCDNNSLTNLNTGQNTLLKHLSCFNNDLTSLDVSQNAALTHLSCRQNVLSNINVTQNINLAYFDCAYNLLQNLNLTQNTLLEKLFVHSNSLTSLNVSQNLALKELHCTTNQLTSLSVALNTNLANLSCGYNQLTSLDVSTLTGLKELYCFSNPLMNINVTQNTLLTTLNCSSNQLTNLDVSQNVSLRELICSNNQLTNLNVGTNNILLSLICDNNPLTALDVTQNAFILNLDIRNTQISNLNLSQNNNLQSLNVSSTLIANLDVTQNSNLKFLTATNNGMSSLDVSQNPLLQTLILTTNNLSTLNFSQNGNLKRLELNSNQFTALDFSSLSSLEYLDVRYNQFVNIDLSSCYNLKDLKCNNNTLEMLNLKNGNLGYSFQIGRIQLSSSYNLEYICADEDDIAMLQQIVNSSTCHVNSYCTFTPGGAFYTISGDNRYDFDSNGCGPNDFMYSNLKLEFSTGSTVGNLIANGTGNYFYDVQEGIHTVNPILENPSYFSVTPTTATVNFPTQASPFIQDFCVTKTGVHSDVEIVIIPIVPARPGFDAKYRLIYRNKGTEIENGNVVFNFDDSVLDYITSVPAYDSASPNAFTWNYTNLIPFESRVIDIEFNVNSPTETPAVNIDDVLSYTAVIGTQNTDETPADNSPTNNQVVVGSYDPNDKTCLEGETINPSMIGEYVHYVIRFENTGTYPAENIVVRDDIDTTKFDIATLVPLSASHEFYTRINGNKVEFIFENINLDFDDATNDGYVAFKIKTLSTLTVNSTISNTAKIYFDYNYPIVTNTATSTYQVLNAQSFEFDSVFTLYPNPAKAVLHLQVKNSNAIQSIEIYNIVGQLVLGLPNASSSIDVSSLESGTYFMKINTDNGSTATKFIKE